MKRLLVLLALLIPLAVCQASGQRLRLGEEAGQLLPVSAIALSSHREILRLTVESIRQDSLDGGASPAYLAAEGVDCAAVFEEADQMLAHRLYLSHAQALVISEDWARYHLPALVEYLISRTDARLTLRIAVAREVSPESVLCAPSVAEEIPGVALASLLDKRAEEGQTADLPLYQLLDLMLNERAFALPALTLGVDGHAQPAGEAYFEKGRLTGFSQEDAYDE